MAKRLALAALSVLALLATLLVAPSATAGDPSPYPGSVQTSVKLQLSPKTVRSGKAVKARVAVVTRTGVRARGRVTVQVKGPGGFNRTVRTAYDGRTLILTLGSPTKRGIYKVTVRFDGQDTVFRDSQAKTTFKVKKKK